MQPRRVQLIDIRSEQPLDDRWSPTVDPSEIEAANFLLAERNLPFQWRFIPSTITLSGAAILNAQAGNDPIQIRPVGPGG